MKNMIQHMPLEIIGLILDDLWGSDLRACLGVARTFHTCAAARIFSSVHIRFGFQGAPEVLNNRSSYLWDTCARWLKAETEANMQSCAVLSAIEHWPSFAQAIRKLTVHARYGRDGAVFQQHALIHAIRHLPNLVEFNWVGSSPAIHSDVVQALIEFCPNLRTFTFEDDANLEEMPLDDLDSGVPCLEFRHLKAISVTSQNSMYEGSSSSHNYLEQALNFVSANASSLTSLSISGAILEHYPFRMLEGVMHLELFGIPDQITLALGYTSSLQSLDLRECIPTTLALLARCTGIGQLVSFSFMACDDWLDILRDDEPDQQALSLFLGRLPRLSRLNLCVPGFDDDDLWITSLQAITIMSQRLNALGLDFEFIDSHATFSLISSCLGPNLHALSLNLPWRPSELGLEAFSPLRDKIADLPALNFLHIGWGPTNDFHLDAEDVVREQPNLRMLVLGSSTPAAWDILSPVAPHSNFRMERWPWRRVKERCLDDFQVGTKDGEWLVRYRIGKSMDPHV